MHMRVEIIRESCQANQGRHISDAFNTPNTIFNLCDFLHTMWLKYILRTFCFENTYFTLQKHLEEHKYTSAEGNQNDYFGRGQVIITTKKNGVRGVESNGTEIILRTLLFYPSPRTKTLAKVFRCFFLSIFITFIDFAIFNCKQSISRFSKLCYAINID